MADTAVVGRQYLRVSEKLGYKQVLKITDLSTTILLYRSLLTRLNQSGHNHEETIKLTKLYHCRLITAVCLSLY